MASVDTEDDQVLSVIYGDHEPDDWASKHQISLSEMASRLNAKQHFDNRGRQIWTDGVEEATIQWQTSIIGAGSISRSTLAAWRGAASAELMTPAVGGPVTTLFKHFYNPNTGRYGIEVALSSDNLTFAGFQLEFRYYTGSQLIDTVLRVDGTTGMLYYRDHLNNFVSLGRSICRRDNIHFWHKLKLVVDVDEQEYIRILVDGMEFNMSGIPVHVLNNLNCNSILVRLHMLGSGTAVEKIYLDDFIYTHLEP